MARFLSRALVYGAAFSLGLELGEQIRFRRLERRRASEKYREELSERAAGLVLELMQLDAELRGVVHHP